MVFVKKSDLKYLELGFGIKIISNHSTYCVAHTVMESVLNLTIIEEFWVQVYIINLYTAAWVKILYCFKFIPCLENADLTIE